MDNKRVIVPLDFPDAEAALALGADYLVSGRPIAQSRDPVATLESIRNTLTAETS